MSDRRPEWDVNISEGIGCFLGLAGLSLLVVAYAFATWLLR